MPSDQAGARGQLALTVVVIWANVSVSGAQHDGLESEDLARMKQFETNHLVSLPVAATKLGGMSR
jgi:hypothetical protein